MSELMIVVKLRTTHDKGKKIKIVLHMLEMGDEPSEVRRK
jgi:hypothetical protein